MYNRLVSKECKIAVVGLGYVGLPIALAFAKTVPVIGFDISSERIGMLRERVDPSGEVAASEFDGCDITFTADTEVLSQASFYIIAVPTPIDKSNKPDLTPLLSASATVGRVLGKGDYVVYESTVYPSCTEEDCIPVLERESGLLFREDFMVGYSPERINPGDREHTLRTIVKVVSGCSDESLEQIAQVYELVVDAGVHRAPSIRVAEAAKVIENAQRDLNIAFMNELSTVFDAMGVNTYDVLEASGTKWNFLNFKPGLVGGHCIGVDPYYLITRAEKLGVTPKLILAARETNNAMGRNVARKLVKEMIRKGIHITTARVLVMGATFKEDVEDIRNTRVVDVIREIKALGTQVMVTDPHADPRAFAREYGIQLSSELGGGYDAIVLAVGHQVYMDMDASCYAAMCKPNAVLFDLKGLLKGDLGDITHITL
jgi:UDP-N-acetyl-D-glucosamine/UDP-N-acetyl-D-galactosamine dehydrogenase